MAVRGNRRLRSADGPRRPIMSPPARLAARALRACGRRPPFSASERGPVARRPVSAILRHVSAAGYIVIIWSRYRFHMAKSSRAKPDSEMVTVYGKITRELAERLDRLADERRWSRAQMVAYCIEQFVNGSANAQQK